MTRTFTLRGLRLADAPDLARLDGAEELRLELDGQLAHLVEEHRTAVGGLERADAIAVGAREAAAQVPEELGLDQVRADGAAVDDDERLLGARAPLADLVRDELLAGAALALDEDVDVARRHLLEQREELAHRHARPRELPEGRDHRHDGLPRRSHGPHADDRVARARASRRAGRSASRMRTLSSRVPFSDPQSRTRHAPSSRTRRQ